MSGAANGVTGAQGSGALAGVLMGNVDGLTPDALFTYCSARINGIDAQVKEAFTQQQKNNDTQAAIADLMSSLNLAAAGGTNGSNNWVQANIGWYWNAINKAGGPNTPEGQKLLQQMQAFCGKADPSGTLGHIACDPGLQDFKDILAGKYPSDKDLVENHLHQHFGDANGVIGHDDIANTVKSLQDASDELGKGGELMMIKLQSLMSQRQLAIQITTNLIQTLHDSSKTIAQNLHG